MRDRSLTYVFLVQGEGRGHMTQAITLSEILEKAGHRVACVFVGSNTRRIVPDFFHSNVRAEAVELLPSPGFVTDKNAKGIRIRATIVQSLIGLIKYVQSMIRIHRVVKEQHPDVLVNFYDPLGGLYNFFFRPDVSYICIGHQFLAYHQDFQFAPGTIDKWLFQLNNMITALCAQRLLALSFSSCSRPKNNRLRVLPPLLRKEVRQQKTGNGDYILVYVLNKGYGMELMDWHQFNRDVKLHCFWDNQEYEGEFSPHPNLTFHRLDDKKFLSLMSACKGFVSTAGFESICEAIYLGKPVMTVPVDGHYEQACNAIDACNAGAGITADSFELSSFIQFIEYFKGSQDEFRNWVSQAEDRILYTLNEFVKEKAFRKDIPLVQPPLALPQHVH